MDEIQYIGNTYFLENDVSIDCNGYDTPVEPHTHNFIEFVYILKGKCLHTVNGTAYPLDSGDLLIVNYNEVHGFTGDSDLRFYNILIKPSIIDQSLAECRDLFSLFETAPFREFKHLIHDGCRFIRFSPDEKNCFEYMLQLLEKELGTTLFERSTHHVALTDNGILCQNHRSIIAALCVQLLCQFRIGDGNDLRRQQSGIDTAVDGYGCNRNARGHLHGSKQCIQAVHHTALAGDACTG